MCLRGGLVLQFCTRMDTLLAHLDTRKPFSALVVGDFMVDELVYGDAERLSADAPVPVLHVRKIERTPGGAANLCLGLAALGASVIAVGVVGDDEPGAFLSRTLHEQGIDTQSVVCDRGAGGGGVGGGGARPTTLKRNLVGLAQQRHPQKMFRVDYESHEPISEQITAELLDHIRAALTKVDVLCIEDYAKGVCTTLFCQAIIAAAQHAGVPVFVDPAKQRDFSMYAGCTAITPNRNEAEYATGLTATTDQNDENTAVFEHNTALAHTLLAQLDCDAVVLTLDRHGALLLERDGEATAVPTVARQVYDVTGAGDIFLAGLAWARAQNLAWSEATCFANAAAGLEVEVFGACPIPIERIHQQVLAQTTATQGKLRTLDQLLIECRAWRSQGKRIVLTNGCFDVLHAGHVSLLDRAKRLGDILIVATNTDERIAQYKGANRPVNGLAQRALVLSGLAAVDAVVVFEEETPIEILEKIRPDVLAKGDEYELDQIPGASLVQGYGGRVERLPMVAGYSSTQTLRKLGDPRAQVSAAAETRSRFVQDRD